MADVTPDGSVSKWVKAHPAFLLGIGTGALALIKIVAVSNFVLSTQLAIATNADPVAVVIGSVLSLVPSIAVLVFGVGSVVFALDYRGMRNYAILGMALSGYGLAQMPFVTRVAPAIGVVVVGIVTARAFHGSGSLWKVSGLGLGIVALGVSANPRVWLAPENIRLDDGTVTVGYVLDPGSDPLPVLLHVERTVVLLSSEEIATRTQCRTRGASRSIVDFLSRSDPTSGNLPACDTQHASLRPTTKDLFVSRSS